MGFSIRDAMSEFGPPWMNAEVTGTIKRSFTTVIDALGDRVEQGVKLRFPNEDCPSALGYIGNDRQIERGPFQTHAGYAAQLRKAFDTWANAGHPETILTQLQAYFAGQVCPPMRLVTERGYAGAGQIPGTDITGIGPGAFGGDTGGGGTETPPSPPPDSPADIFDSLQWLMPVTGVSGPGYGTTPASTSASGAMSGLSGRRYSVTLSFRGIVEVADYTGGTNDGAFWQVGGAPVPTPPGTNVYSLTITHPDDATQVYYLNRGHAGAEAYPVGPTATWEINFTKTLTIREGSTIDLFADSRDGFGAINSTGSLSGITSPAQPYAGQFIVMRATLIALLDP